MYFICQYSFLLSFISGGRGQKVSNHSPAVYPREKKNPCPKTSQPGLYLRLWCLVDIMYFIKCVYFTFVFPGEWLLSRLSWSAWFYLTLPTGLWIKLEKLITGGYVGKGNYCNWCVDSVATQLEHHSGFTPRQVEQHFQINCELHSFTVMYISNALLQCVYCR